MKVPDVELQKLKDPGLFDFIDFVRIILNNGRVEFRVVSDVPTWTGNEGEVVLYSAGAARGLYAYLGAAWQRVSFSGGGVLLQDADADTKVDVEESADDDTIRFDCAGSEQATMVDGTIAPTTTSDVFLGSSTKQFKFIVENRTNDTGCTETGRIWLRTDV